MPTRWELFHEVADPASAQVRKRIGALGLRIAFRNVAFDSHRAALEGHGGSAVPALWDGERLVSGVEAVLRALDALATSGPP